MRKLLTFPRCADGCGGVGDKAMRFEPAPAYGGAEESGGKDRTADCRDVSWCGVHTSGAARMLVVESL